METLAYKEEEEEDNATTACDIKLQKEMILDEEMELICDTRPN